MDKQRMLLGKSVQAILNREESIEPLAAAVLTNAWAKGGMFIGETIDRSQKRFSVHRRPRTSSGLHL